MSSAGRPRPWPAAGGSSWLDVLANGERTVEALAGVAGLSVANTASTCRSFARPAWSLRREGTSIHYRLAGPEVFELWRTLRTLAAGRWRGRAAGRRLPRGRDELEPVTREELARRLQDGDLVVLDVRPAAEYAASHLPGAVSIPVGELRRRLAELPADREIVAYCRGPYCAFAHEAVELLREEGFRLGGWRMAARMAGRRPGRHPHLTTDPRRSQPLPFTRSSTKAWATAPMWSSWATAGPGHRSGPRPHPVPGAGPLAAAADRLCRRDPPARRLPDRQPELAADGAQVLAPARAGSASPIAAWRTPRRSTWAG